MRLAIAALLLWLQISTRIRDWAEERTRSRLYQVMLYALVYVPLVTVITLPLVFYEGYLREHAYGLSNQSLTAWLGDFGTQFLLTLVAGLVLLPVLYGIIRRTREDWWLWGAGLGHHLSGSGRGDLSDLRRAAVQPVFAPARRPA